MKQRAAAFVAAAIALGASSEAALAGGSPASPKASCVATITSYEATQLQPGAVGEEVSGIATSGSGVLGSLVSELGHAHTGSIEACFAVEE